MANTYLTRTVSSGADITKCTFSFWVKRSILGGDQRIFSNENTTNKQLYIRFNANNTFTCYARNGASTNAFSFDTNRVFRDCSSWYHFCIKFDSTQSTEADRFKLYVNGVAETSFSSASYPSLNELALFTNTSEKMNIGYNDGGNNQYFNGCLSHVYFTQGYAYDASTFGSVDATTGEWKINTSPSVTYGTNGFLILKDGNTITDQSSNSNNFTSSGAGVTKTEDNPSNSFATYVPAQVFHSGGHDTTNGGTVGTNSTNSWYWRPASLAATTGKFYAEAKVTADGGGTLVIGIADLDDCVGYAPVDTHFGKTPVSPNGRGYAWYSDDGKIYYNDTSTSVITSGEYGANDILMIAMDLDNGAWYIGKNGSWLNSGDPTSGSSKTGAVNTWTGGGTWTFADAHANSGEFSWNWGNGYFKTTAISSEGTNASGIGKFEYNVPANYTALSTKGLNE
ncbi:lectin domain containing protein [Pelagibacter phage HTVC105P]|nr:lectin domain containing protein [Pelagibacter phage HTVC105P]